MNTIIKTFDTWTTAQTPKTSGRGNRSNNQSLLGIQKLRELILELAVRGKLVPQDPTDEPASILLKKIANEKKRLIKEGKIKKQEDLLEVGEDEEPFDLPEGWKWERLGTVTTYGIMEKAEPSDVDENTWVLDLEDIEKETSKLLQKVRFSDKQFQSSKNRFYIDDVIYGKLRPYLDKVLVADEMGVCTTEMIPINGYGNIAPQYLRLALKTPYFIKYANESTHGMNLPRLGTEKARLACIPLPPLAEQHRIVAKVDELMALCDQLEQQQTESNAAHQTLVELLLGTLTTAASQTEFEEAWQRIANHFDTLFTTEYSIDQLKQTILQLAVIGKLVPQNPNDEPASELLKKIAKEKARLVKEGKIKKQAPLPEITENEKPFGLPRNWEVSRLGTFTIVGTGTTPSRDKMSYYEPKEFHWVTSGETSQDFIFDTNEKISSLALKETNVSIYPKGSLIVAMYGQGKTRGQVSELMIEAGTNQACAAIVLINKEESHRKYLKYFFKKAYEEIREQAAGGAQPNLNLGKVSNTVIPIAPLPEQHRIVAKVDELFAICDALKERINQTQTTQNLLAGAVVERALTKQVAGKVIYTTSEQVSMAAEPE